MDIFGGGLVGRPAQKIGKPFDVADILVVRPGAEPAKRHVLDQPPASRTDGLVGHWGLLSWVRSSAPRSQDRTPASATPRDPSLATNYRGSGLVLRRILPIPAHSGGGRLPERTPAVQPSRRERVKVPHSRRPCSAWIGGVAWKPGYSMTSSARARIAGGIVRPSASAAFRLTTSSNLTGCCTGRSAGLAPLRILST